jgi:hypothetical protein
MANEFVSDVFERIGTFPPQRIHMIENARRYTKTRCCACTLYRFQSRLGGIEDDAMQCSLNLAE